MSNPTLTGPESWVYMVRCADGSLYTGWTDDLGKRMAAHRSGKGSKCVHGRGFAHLAWAERQADPGRGPGQRREAEVKALPKERKEAMAAAWAEAHRVRLSMAAPGDAAEVLELYGWYVDNSVATFVTERPTVEEYRDYIAGILEKGPFLLARGGDGRLLGFACAHPWRPYAAYAWDAETGIYCSSCPGHGGGADPVFRAAGHSAGAGLLERLRGGHHPQPPLGCAAPGAGLQKGERQPPLRLQGRALAGHYPLADEPA